MPYRRTPAIQARLDATRDRIVDAAITRVATGGWRAATVAGVAAEAGVATGTVYRHLADKDDLLAATFRRAAARELEVVTAAARAPGPSSQRLGAALRVFADRALRGRRLAYALLAEPAGTAIEEARLAFRGSYRAVFAQVLREGIDDGEVAEHDVEVVAAALIGAMGEALVGPLAPVGAEDDATATEAGISTLVVTCLRAVPSTTYDGDDPTTPSDGDPP